MKILCRLSLLIFVWNLASACFAQQKSGVVVVNPSSKELKRTAHRLRIPVEQLKNARDALKQTTDLVKKMDPCPASQIKTLASMWTQLDRSKSKDVIDSLISVLRLEAADSTTFQRYRTVTNLARSLMLVNYSADPEKVLQMLRNWPEPKMRTSDELKSFREKLESQARAELLSRIAYQYPEKAMAMLPQPGTSDYPYDAAIQVAYGLVNDGKKDTAMQLLDQVTNGFDTNTSEIKALDNYEGFIWRLVSFDGNRAATAVGRLAAALMNVPTSDDCNAIAFRSGEKSVSLTCAETRVYKLARNHYKPEFQAKALDALPGLKSKLDSIGGIDVAFGGDAFTNTTYSSDISPRTSPADAFALFRELRGKDEATIKGRVKDTNIEALMDTALEVALPESDFSATLLDIADPLLSQVEPLKKRAAVLQKLIQAHNKIEGEPDPALIKTGFTIVDQLRQEASEKAENTEPHSRKTDPKEEILRFGTQADQLEAFLVAELSRNSYESAMHYARSIEDDTVKLQCLLQIIKTLGSSNY